MNPQQEPLHLPDLKPYNVDPILLGRLAAMKVRPSYVWLAAIVVIAGSIIWSALASDLFFWSAGQSTLWQDIWSFVLHKSLDDTGQSVPYLRDYPSLVLTVTVISAIGLVYTLYGDAARLHSDLEESGCVTYKDANLADLIKRINDVNATLNKWGKFSILALPLAWLFMFMVNLTMQTDLFAFLSPGLYQNWWASLVPLRPGGVVWVFAGGLGIYMVYVEAVLGLTYVRFLRRLHKDGKYEFNANPRNPDGFFGWSRLRRVITNLQAGAVCTMISAWTFSFFLQPAVGIIMTIALLAVFVSIVMYVYFSVTTNFRRQVGQSKARQANEVGNRLAHHLRLADQRFDHETQPPGPRPVPADGITDNERLLYLLVSYRQLEHISMIPSAPVRQKWLVPGLLSLLGTLSAIVIPILQYFD